MSKTQDKLKSSCRHVGFCFVFVQPFVDAFLGLNRFWFLNLYVGGSWCKQHLYKINRTSKNHMSGKHVPALKFPCYLCFVFHDVFIVICSLHS